MIKNKGNYAIWVPDKSLIDLEQRNDLLVKRLKWTHEQLDITLQQLRRTESERQRLKEKSDRLRKELYQLKIKNHEQRI